MSKILNKKEETPSQEENKEEIKKVDYTDFLEQVRSEHEAAVTFIQPKWDLWKNRLKLYNNQKKDPKAIGDVLLFTIFQTVFAQLYVDQLQASFVPRGDGDEERAELWTSMAEFDHDEMERTESDYAWIWDAMFFGKGLQLLMEFDSETKTPVQEIIDPLTFLRDPIATSTQGTGKKKKGAMRFCGWHIQLTKFEIEKSGLYQNYSEVFDKKGSQSQLDKTISENRKERASAQGTGDPTASSNLTGDNQTINAINWMTRRDGKLIYAVVTTDFKEVLRYDELPYESFPIIERSIFPTSHDWDGVSIPDLIEDKQRARAVLQNLSLKSAELNLYNTVVYDKSRITNKNDLNREMDKHIGVNGNTAGVITNVQRNPIGTEVQFIMGLLSNSAQTATATPNQAQGMPSDRKNTATADVLIDKKVDERRSLTAKVFGWSEKKFWKQWYMLYNEYFDAKIDTKVVRITGAFGDSFKEIRMSDLKTEKHPDVRVESVEVSDAKRFNKLQSFSTYIALIAQDPNANLRYAFKRSGELRGLKADEIERLLPDSIDELEAKAENKELSENKSVQIDVNEDHKLHLEIHTKAKDSKAKEMHILAHQQALLLKRDRPDIFGEEAESESGMNTSQGQVNLSGGQEVAPAQSEIKPLR